MREKSGQAITPSYGAAMFVISYIFSALAVILESLIFIYSIVVLVSCLFSFIRPDPMNTLVRAVRMLTEPVLYKIRKKLPFVFQAGFDFSPLVLILALQFINLTVVRILNHLAHKLL